MKKSISKIEKGVKISFTGDVQKQNIVKMVKNCTGGTCDCMSDEVKAKIEDMEVLGKDGDVELRLTGDIDKEEIQAALQKSKVINSKQYPKR